MKKIFAILGAILSVIYLVSPVDLIPELTFGPLGLLDDEEARKNIKEKEAYWKNLGVNSVPTIVFDRKSAVTGAQPVDVFKQVLTELINEA